MFGRRVSPRPLALKIIYNLTMLLVVAALLVGVIDVRAATPLYCYCCRVFSASPVHPSAKRTLRCSVEYTLEVAQDARDYADHAGRLDIGMEDVRLAVRRKQDSLSTGPSREDHIREGDELNRIPLRAIPDLFGARLPPFEYQTTLPNLQWEAKMEPAPTDSKDSAMDVDPEEAPHGNRNKKAKITPGLETKKPLVLREKKEQEETIRAKAEAKARRCMQAQSGRRG
ncbi:unnamed protein product [Pylaiella littoralis]